MHISSLREKYHTQPLENGLHQLVQVPVPELLHGHKSLPALVIHVNHEIPAFLYLLLLLRNSAGAGAANSCETCPDSNHYFAMVSWPPSLLS